MTNEEAIKIIIDIRNNYHVDTMTNRRIDKALFTAIQALKADPKHGCPNCGARIDEVEE